MSNVRTLDVVKPTEPNKDALDAARHLLTRVEAGDIESFAYAAAHHDGSVTTTSTKTERLHVLIGAIERLKFRMLGGQD